ncbi:MAG: outer membrane beta-barrel protein [Methyloprofundus sp.]|nr:outer membrane beta-barrel protein [Methyloprofundus sp.]
MQRNNFFFIPKISLLAVGLVISNIVQAEWSGGTNFSTYYTDDVGLFSVTRRLSLEEDPTQPIVDEPNQGADFVYEPSVYVNWETENRLGEFQIALDAGGYIFQDHSDYTHGFFQLAVEQGLAEGTTLKFFYDFIPNLYLGKNSLSHEQHGHVEEHNEHEADEQLDSHLLTMHLEQELAGHLVLRGLVRYGLRLYDEPFGYRDTQFFTLGTHLEWVITHDIELLVGYHFERGYTDKNATVKYQDDIGYINHFASAELKIRLLPSLVLIAIFDYEHNDFTSSYINDLHHNGNENVYQGELELLYEVTESTTLKAGWQQGRRKFNYEDHSVRNNNAWIGVEFHF